jgi:hypothetical protein
MTYKNVFKSNQFYKNRENDMRMQQLSMYKKRLKNLQPGKNLIPAHEPKKAKNAYIYFCLEWRKKISSDYLGEDYNNISVILENIWKQFSNNQRNVFIYMADDDYIRYYKEKKEANKHNLVLAQSGERCFLNKKIEKLTNFN